MPPRYPTAPVSSKQGSAFYGAYFAVLGVVLPHLGPYLASRGTSAVWVGIAMAAFSLAKLVYSPFVAGLVDRGGSRPGLLAGHVAVSLAAAAAMPWLDGGAALCAALFVVGLGYGTVLPLVEAAVLERLPDTGYGPMRLWGSAGFVAAALGSSAVVDGRPGLFPWALVASLVVLCAAALPFEIAGAPARDRRRSVGDGIPASTWGLLTVLTVHQVSHGPYYAFLSLYLEQAGYAVAWLGALWSIGVVAEAAAFRWGGALERTLGLRAIVTVALVATPLRWVLLAVPPVPPVIVAAQLLHAVTFGLAHLGGVQLVQASVPEGGRRRAQALYSGLAFGLGIVAGSAASGPLYAAGGGRAAFLAAAATSLAVLGGWLALRRRLASSGSPASPTS